MAERENVSLVCKECGNRNYRVTTKRGKPAPLSIKKFCATCGHHTEHQQSR